MAITSIVDYLKSQGQDSSYAARKARPGWERQRKHHLRMFFQEQAHPDPRVRFLNLLPPPDLPLRGEA